VNGALELLRTEIATDRAAFAARVDEIASIRLEASTIDEGLLARAAVALHHAYGAVEAALARIARTFGTQPSGTNWHRSLLETMALEVPGVRPAVVSQEALPDLRELLGFRHFFRHAYQVQLDAGRLVLLRERAMRAKPLVDAIFQRLDSWLARLSAGT
jgi:hypothetical protein